MVTTSECYQTFFQSPGPQASAERTELNSKLNSDPYVGHVLYPTFGYYETKDGLSDDMIGRIIDFLKDNKTYIAKGIVARGFATERLMQETYADIFKTANLDDESRPFALSEVNNVDGLHELGPVYTRIRHFRLYNVHERYGISLIEFLHMPRHISDMILNECQEATLKNLQNANKGKMSERNIRREFEKDNNL